MIKLPIKASQVARAQIMSGEMGALRNSHLPNAEGNLPGFVGEIMVADHFGWKQSNTFEWDLTNDRGSKIEVKTKRCNTPPKSHYWVAIEQRHQQACDFYVFTRVLNDLSAGWILGWIKPADFKRAGKEFPKGTSDPHAKGWTNHDRYSDLRIDNVIYRHGDKGKGGQRIAALANAQAEHCSVVQGHLHSQFGVEFAANADRVIFGLQTGCGCMPNHPAMNYSRVFSKRPILGCAVVLNGEPIMERMKL